MDQSTLGQYSINTLVDTRWTLDPHLCRQSGKSELIFADMECQSSVDQDIDQVLTILLYEYRLRCWLSVDRDIDRMLIQGWTRVSVDTQPFKSWASMIQNILLFLSSVHPLVYALNLFCILLFIFDLVVHIIFLTWPVFWSRSAEGGWWNG